MKPLDSLSDDEFAATVQRAAALRDAPPRFVNAAVALWAQQQPSLFRRILATLSFDSFAAPALAAGMRSAATDTRHLLFAAEGRDIDLRIARAGASFTLSGQVLGPDESGQLALAAEGPSGAHDMRHAALDALGGFQFDGLGPGRYRLCLVAGGEEIELPSLEIGERHA